MSLTPEVDEAVQKLTILVAPLLAGVLIYTILAAYLVASGTFAAENQAIMEFLPFVAVGLAPLLVAAPFVSKKILDSADRTAAATLRAWRTAHITAMAMREGLGLAGVTLGLLAGSVPWIVGLGTASLAAMALGWPRRLDLEERLRKTER